MISDYMPNLSLGTKKILIWSLVGLLILVGLAMGLKAVWNFLSKGNDDKEGGKEDGQGGNGNGNAGPVQPSPGNIALAEKLNKMLDKEWEGFLGCSDKELCAVLGEVNNFDPAALKVFNDYYSTRYGKSVRTHLQAQKCGCEDNWFGFGSADFKAILLEKLP